MLSFQPQFFSISNPLCGAILNEVPDPDSQFVAGYQSKLCRGHSLIIQAKKTWQPTLLGTLSRTPVECPFGSTILTAVGTCPRLFHQPETLAQTQAHTDCLLTYILFLSLWLPLLKKHAYHILWIAVIFLNLNHTSYRSHTCIR